MQKENSIHCDFILNKTKFGSLDQRLGAPPLAIILSITVCGCETYPVPWPRSILRQLWMRACAVQGLSFLHAYSGAETMTALLFVVSDVHIVTMSLAGAAEPHNRSVTCQEDELVSIIPLVWRPGNNLSFRSDSQYVLRQNNSCVATLAGKSSHWSDPHVASCSYCVGASWSEVRYEFILNSFMRTLTIKQLPKVRVTRVVSRLICFLCHSHNSLTNHH